MDLYGLYETQVQYIQSGPGLTLEYNYALLNWLVLGGQFNYHRVIWDQYSRVGGNRANYTNTKNKVALLPQAKFRIPGMKRFRRHDAEYRPLLYPRSRGVCLGRGAHRLRMGRAARLWNGGVGLRQCH